MQPVDAVSRSRVELQRDVVAAAGRPARVRIVAGKKTVSKKSVTPLGMRYMTNRFSSSSAGISRPSRR